MSFKDVDKICDIDPKKLYTNVLKQGLPFYEWPKWIDKELGRMYLEKIYQERQLKKTQSLKRCLAVRKELMTHHYYAAFTLTPDYFYNEIRKSYF